MDILGLLNWNDFAKPVVDGVFCGFFYLGASSKALVAQLSELFLLNLPLIFIT